MIEFKLQQTQEATHIPTAIWIISVPRTRLSPTREPWLKESRLDRDAALYCLCTRTIRLRVCSTNLNIAPQTGLESKLPRMHIYVLLTCSCKFEFQVYGRATTTFLHLPAKTRTISLNCFLSTRSRSGQRDHNRLYLASSKCIKDQLEPAIFPRLAYHPFALPVKASPLHTYTSMDAFTTTVPRNIEDVVLPPVNEDGGTGSSGSCVVCKEDTSLPPVNEDGGTGSSGSCVIA
ncbi:hypothetical protein C8F01DRAFT_564933 [Mycena amicta]|nr:hypothetical protein C8F01DRAFT_564933 [Mycena amicta]